MDISDIGFLENRAVISEVGFSNQEIGTEIFSSLLQDEISSKPVSSTKGNESKIFSMDEYDTEKKDTNNIEDIDIDVTDYSLPEIDYNSPNIIEFLKSIGIENSDIDTLINSIGGEEIDNVDFLKSIESIQISEADWSLVKIKEELTKMAQKMETGGFFLDLVALIEEKINSDELAGYGKAITPMKDEKVEPSFNVFSQGDEPLDESIENTDRLPAVDKLTKDEKVKPSFNVFGQGDEPLDESIETADRLSAADKLSVETSSLSESKKLHGNVKKEMDLVDVRTMSLKEMSNQEQLTKAYYPRDLSKEYSNTEGLSSSENGLTNMLYQETKELHETIGSKFNVANMASISQDLLKKGQIREVDGSNMMTNDFQSKLLKQDLLNQSSGLSDGFNEKRGIKTESILEQKILTQIRGRIYTLKDEKEINIRLTPPSLGRLHMKIHSSTSHAVKVIMVTENHFTKGVIEANLNDLKSALAQQGISAEQFEVNVFGEDSSKERDQRSLWGSDLKFTGGIQGQEEEGQSDIAHAIRDIRPANTLVNLFI